MDNILLFLFLIVVGIIETFLNTCYLISVNKRQVYLATFLEFIYCFVYLFVVSLALKNANTFILLCGYASGCALGTYIRLTRDKK